jgi:DNA gyrase subunit A
MAELADLEQKIAYYKDILSDEKKILGVVESETRALPAQLAPRDRRRRRYSRRRSGTPRTRTSSRKRMWSF